MYELARVLRVCIGLSAAFQRHVMSSYCCGSGGTNKLFVCASYFNGEPKKLLQIDGCVG